MAPDLPIYQYQVADIFALDSQYTGVIVLPTMRMMEQTDLEAEHRMMYMTWFQYFDHLPSGREDCTISRFSLSDFD